MSPEIPLPPGRATPQRLRELIEAVYARRLYHGAMVPRDLHNLVFMPVAFFAEGRIAELRAAGWDDYLPYGIVGTHVTSGRSIDGWPIFMEVAWVHVGDLDTAITTAQRMWAAAEQALADAPITKPPAAR